MKARSLAEGLLNYTRLDDPAEVVTATQGRPLSPADEVRLVDELDRDVPPGAPGALLTRGPYTPRGYYRAPEHNRRSFTADGWYRRPARGLTPGQLPGCAGWPAGQVTARRESPAAWPRSGRRYLKISHEMIDL